MSPAQTSSLTGFLVVDKPEGPTSHDLVGILRSITGVKKVGHTGTLDPFATGALPLAFGQATRLIQFLDEGRKVYRATLRLGQATDTLDRDGQVVEEAPVPALDGVQEVLAGFIGEGVQAPPAFSAVRVDGQRAYQLARQGKEVKTQPRPIHIHALRLLAVDRGELQFEVTCSKGTYVRVLGEDIARALGTVGHLSALRRLASGPFSVADGVTLGDLAELACGSEDWSRAFSRNRDERLPRRPRGEVAEALAGRLVGPVDALRHLPEVEVDDRTAARLRLGVKPSPRGQDGRYIATHRGRLVAVCLESEGSARLLRVMNS